MLCPYYYYYGYRGFKAAGGQPPARTAWGSAALAGSVIPVRLKPDPPRGKSYE